MSLQKSKKSKKTLKIIAAVIAVILLAGGGVFAYWQATKPNQNKDNQNNNQTNNQSGSSTTSSEDDQNDISSSTPSNETNTESKTPEQYSDDSSSSSTQSGRLSINAFQADSVVRVTVSINQIWSSGTCSLSITNGTSSTTKTAPIQAMPSYSTCQGFSIPVSELGAGTWKLSLSATHEAQTLTGAQEVRVQ